MSAIEPLIAAEQALSALGPLPFPLPLGPLAPVVAGVFSGAERSDWIVCGPRERVGAVLRGCPVERLVDPAAGARPYRVAPASGAPGARALHAVGLSVASGERVVCILGDASVASGDFYEALNTACLMAARVTFVVVRQALDEGAPVGTQTATSAVALAKAFSLPTHEASAEADAVANALRDARVAEGPSLVQVHLTR